MPKVTTIPPRKQRNHAVASQETRKIRVAAYCRVSTDTEEQATSYQAQIAHYEEVIHRNPEWVFAGIYADDGISATSTKHREQFHQMIQDCMDGKIDMLITKSISRFARNTVDCLNYIRQLKAQNIPIYFEKESINTMECERGSADYHYGISGTTGIRISESECQTGNAVSVSTGKGDGQCQLFSWL